MGFYYLKSRYYDPSICRFINADGIVATDQGFIGCNLFVYCLNNPVVNYDDGGYKPKSYDETWDDEDECIIFPGDNNSSDGVVSASETWSGSVSNIPQEAYDTYDYVSTHNGSPPPGYKGGATFANDGRGNTASLPGEYAPFKEYDIYPKVPGLSRGVERIVIGSGGVAWYTSDHYISFICMDR